MRKICKLLDQRTKYLFGQDECTARQRRLRDGSLVVVVWLSSCLVLTTTYRTGLTSSYLLSCVCACVAAVGLMWRRSRPELSLVLALGATLASDEGTCLIAAAYSVGLYGKRHRTLILVGTALAYFTTREVAGEFVADPVWRLYMVALYLVVPAVGSQFVRQQRVLKEHLREQLSRAAAATDSAARFAILERRTRLAFEIHDTVGHSATFVILRASAAARLPDLTPAAKTAFEEIQEGAIVVMQELRNVIGVLRDDSFDEDSALRSQISCDEFLEGLARNMRAVGMTASYSRVGKTKDLGSRNESLFYRVSREALANAAKYAPGAPIQLQLAVNDKTATLTVHNGRALQKQTVVSSGHVGLQSLKAAVAEAGGVFSSGPLAEGGFQVKAIVPIPST